MLHERQMGRDGQKPETCTVSGKSLIPGDVFFDVNDVKLGVKAQVFRAYRSEYGADAVAQLRKEFARQIGSAADSKSKSGKSAVPDMSHPAGE